MEIAKRLTRARRAAGLTQHELARRTGLHQSVIAAYESGKRHPSEEACRTILTTIGLRPSEMLRAHRDEVAMALAERGIEARVFGSVARGDDDEGSDIDLLVELPVGSDLVDIAELDELLEDIIGTDVDVVSAGGLKPDRLRLHRVILEDTVPL